MILPGLIDAHMHLESTLLTPAELARLIVPMGTTAVISDSHEVGNVMGVRGIDMLAAACEGLPLDLFFMASSCVPATAWEDAGAVLGPGEVKTLLSRPRVLGSGRGDGYPRGAGRRGTTCWKRSSRPCAARARRSTGMPPVCRVGS